MSTPALSLYLGVSRTVIFSFIDENSLPEDFVTVAPTSVNFRMRETMETDILMDVTVDHTGINTSDSTATMELDLSGESIDIEFGPGRYIADLNITFSSGLIYVTAPFFIDVIETVSAQSER